MEGVMEGVTYEILDVVDASAYARLANPEDDQGNVEYLELDMEVVDAVPDADGYFSHGDESQESQDDAPRKVQQLIRVNGNQCIIKQERNVVNGGEGRRKRINSDASLAGDVDREKEKSKKEQTGKSECDSLDLFFQSMAQTVLHLPPQVQARIKMDICKVISRAEIKYCSNGKKG